MNIQYNTCKTIRTFQIELAQIEKEVLSSISFNTKVEIYQLDLDGSGIIDLSDMINEINIH